MMLICLLALGTTVADTLKDDIKALGEADSFDAQLALLDKIAAENAAELEDGFWDIGLTVKAAPDFPEGLIPEDWEKIVYTEADSLLEAMQRGKFIALYCPDDTSEAEFAGDLLARFPAAMRAVSLEEAEYALIVRYSLVPSGYTYIPFGSSSHCDYEAYAIDMKTGETIRFWTHRNEAKRSGKTGQLDGNRFTQWELWAKLRAQFFGELRYAQEDGTVLIFGLTGRNCYLKGFEGELTALDVPAEVEGHPVTEIAEKCFVRNDTLRIARLPEGIGRISDEAFAYCYDLENIELPRTLKTIGRKAFMNCYKLENIELPGTLETIGSEAFRENTRLQRIVLPDSLTSMGEDAFLHCDKMSRIVIGKGLTELADSAFWPGKNIACCYIPTNLKSGLSDSFNNSEDLVIYAPEGSYALQWAAEKGFEYVVCDTPDDMPDVTFIVQGDFEFRVFPGEADLFNYLGKNIKVMIPETADGVPVTRILSGAFNYPGALESLWLPHSIKTVETYAIKFSRECLVHVYIPGMETNLQKNSIYNINDTLLLHAPEGSPAQRYVTKSNSEKILFEAWSEGNGPGASSESDPSSVSDAGFISGALKLAAKVQQNVADFWATCDQEEYAWLGRVPGYDIDKPETAAVLRISQQQFDDLALLLGGKDSVASAFATIVNTQFSLPYAKASAQTAQNEQLDHAGDRSFAIVVLAYRTDIVLAVLQADGSAQAALICSTPDIIRTFSSESVQKIAADFGITDSECTVFKGEELSALMSQ